MWTSKGWARTLGIALMYAGEAMESYPPLQPYAGFVKWAGGLLAGAGVINAVVVTKKK